MERLQKIISDYGLASRREAEKMISERRVTVNGQIAIPGQKADPLKDIIKIDKNPLPRRGSRVYIMLYKPRGYVTTMKDEQGRKTVLELVKGCGARVYPVGRLDMDSEGLLLMTNDGEFTNRLTHPSFHTPKEYYVRVRGFDIKSAVKLLSKDMKADGVIYKAAKVRILEETEASALLSITIGEGKNRQIRRMCEQASLEVLRLKRVSIASLALGNLKPSKWRHLTDAEIESLWKFSNTYR